MSTLLARVFEAGTKDIKAFEETEWERFHTTVLTASNQNLIGQDQTDRFCHPQRGQNYLQSASEASANWHMNF